MMTSNLLQNIEAKEQLQNILQAINEALPDKEPIQRELGKYTRSKDQFIKRLQEQWYGRELPNYTELQVRQMNSAHYSDNAKKQVINDMQRRETIDMEAKSWIIKSSEKWSGWNAAENVYFDTPLLFEGDINYERNFQPLIVSDQASKSVNLITSLSKIIKKGSQMCLSDPNWSILFLTFAKTHLMDDHQTLQQ